MFSILSRRKNITHLGWLGADVHAHLLPGIDDGSPDALTSAGYLKRLKAMGLTHFYATPHIFMEMYPNNADSIGASLRGLRQVLEEKVPDINLFAAAEYMVDDAFGQLYSEGALLTLPGKHVLIEMSYVAESMQIERHIFEMQIRGYTPILAHPERYVFYQGDLSKYKRFKDLGCLLQVNLLSPSGYYGPLVKRAALSILKARLADLGGTDLHHGRHLAALEKFVLSGDLHGLFRKNPIKNAELFITKSDDEYKSI